MKKIFKFIIILFCIWAGTKSILEVGRGEDSILSFVIDMGIFILLVGSPAANYWSSVIDKSFNEPDSEEENKNNEN